MLLLISVQVIWFLRIKNFELLIKGNKILHKNIFGIKKRIWLFSGDSNLYELLNYLSNNTFIIQILKIIKS